MVRNDLFVLNLRNMFARDRAMAVGDRAPNFMLRDQQDEVFELYTAIEGGPIVLLFLSREDAGNALLFRQFQEKLPDFKALGTHLFAICDDTVANQACTARELDIRFRLIADPQAKVSRWFLSSARSSPPLAFILDPNQRVRCIEREEDTGADDFVGRVLAAVDRIMPKSEPHCFGALAPALVIPDVFDREYCQRLIWLWETGGHVAGPVRTGSSQGTVKQVDPDFKRRADYVVENPATERDIGTQLFTRIGPEVYKVYHYADWTFEKFRIGCYDAADAGYFKAHRDNSNDAVKHRRYALTVNLNAEQYEGGDLRFPEYGADLYRPPTGGAIVFSCSLLHEVVPVTKGRRFTLVSFLNSPSQEADGQA